MHKKQLLFTLSLFLAASIQPAFGMEQPKELKIARNSSIALTGCDTIASLSPYNFRLINPSTQKCIFNISTYEDEPSYKQCGSATLPSHEFYSMALNKDKTEVAVKSHGDITIYCAKTGTVKFKKQFPGIAAIAFHSNNNFLVTHTLKQKIITNDFLVTHTLEQTIIDLPSSIQIHPRQNKKQTFTTELKSDFDDSRPTKTPFKDLPLKPIMKSHPNKNELAFGSLDRDTITLDNPSIIDPVITFFDKICLINELLDGQFLPKEIKQQILTPRFFDHNKNQLACGTPISAHPPLGESNNFIEYSPDGSKIATVSEHQICIYDTQSKDVMRCDIVRDHDYIESALFHPNNKILIAITNYGLITYWCVKSGKSISVSPSQLAGQISYASAYMDDFSGKPLFQNRLAITQDGKILLVATENVIKYFNIPQEIIESKSPDQPIETTTQPSEYDPWHKKEWVEYIKRTRDKQKITLNALLTYLKNNSLILGASAFSLGGIIVAWIWYNQTHQS